MSKSALEDELLVHIKGLSLPLPQREQRLVPGRHWSCDFVWADYRLVVEVEGGTHTRGSHTRPMRYESDCEKYNAITLLGYTVLRVTSDMVHDGRAIAVIEQAIKAKEVWNMTIRQELIWLPGDQPRAVTPEGTPVLASDAVTRIERER